MHIQFVYVLFQKEEGTDCKSYVDCLVHVQRCLSPLSHEAPNQMPIGAQRKSTKGELNDPQSMNVEYRNELVMGIC